jgi:hypothetical protein
MLSGAENGMRARRWCSMRRPLVRGEKQTVVRLAAILLMAAGQAFAASKLYVDQANPTCSNDGPGSAARPFCTIGARA